MEGQEYHYQCRSCGCFFWSSEALYTDGTIICDECKKGSGEILIKYICQDCDKEYYFEPSSLPGGKEHCEYCEECSGLMIIKNKEVVVSEANVKEEQDVFDDYEKRLVHDRPEPTTIAPTSRPDPALIK